jgi:cytoskeleton protein RodZ
MSEQERQEPVVAAQGRGPDKTGSLGEELAGPTVGERIRRAREAAGLSAADLAQPLNLDLKVIEHIERDELDAVPGRPYILAYLRSWAAQLDLDADALVAQYNAQQAPGSDVVQGGIHPTLDVMEPRRGGAARRLFGWLVLLLLVALVAVGLSKLDTEQLRTWWAELRSVPVETEGQPGVESQQADPTDAERPPIDGALEQPPKPPAEPAPAEMTSAGLPEQRLVAIESVPAREEPESAPAEAAGPVLLLRATEADSWVEVRDANGERLMYDVLSAGEERSFTDVEGPFSLVLGQPRGLEVEYQGEPVELSEPSEATGVLRTTVGNT